MKSEWKPAPGPLTTRWGNNINPDKVHEEYPRPQLMREDWINLNGLWDYAIIPKDGTKPAQYDGKILVPFPVESSLSGVRKNVGEMNELWYRRNIKIPADWQGKRIILNFGGVDWKTFIWINDKLVGFHSGGYDSFKFDITGFLSEEGENELIVKVWDPVNTYTQPRGKQVKDPGGIWYTSVTGIWQTVWMEPVNEINIKNLNIETDIDKNEASIEVNLNKIRKGYSLTGKVFFEGEIVGESESSDSKKLQFKFDKKNLWSPDNPNLYDLELSLLNEKGEILDQVKSYFGMRKISIGKDSEGITRILLNNNFVFQFGPLDQGWWPDGLYTAPSDDALRYDIEITKRLGYNMARKHVKVEPQRWYYWCDKLGLLVWQDMPSGDEYIDPNEPDLVRSPESSEQFEIELGNLIRQFGNHPSIVVWVPFNEGWGQYDTERIVNKIKELDSTRLVINTSGWADRGVGDIHDIHAYPGPAMPDVEEDRAIVLGEFGGLGLPVKGSTWQSEDNWGYRRYENVSQLTDAYTNLIRDLQPMIGKGLSAAVYTQTTDVEVEVNGLLTYDRTMVKIPEDVLIRINQGYLPPVIESSQSIFLESLSVTLSNELKSGEIRYTLNGEDPVENSLAYEGPISLNKSTTIKAKTFWPDGLSSSISEKIFTKVNLNDPTLETEFMPGIKFKYFTEGFENLSQLPDFSTLIPSKEGITYNLNLSEADREEYFGFEFACYVEVDEDGIYRFYLESDDGSRLYIQNQPVVDNDFTHGMTEKTGDIALAAGKHLMKIIYFQGYGGKGLKVSISGPDLIKTEIKSDRLFFTD